MEIINEKLPKDVEKVKSHLSSNVDYERAQFQTITPREAMMLVTQYPESAKNIFVRYRNQIFAVNGEKMRLDCNGYDYAKSTDKYIKANGVEVDKLNLMPLSHIFNIADSIWYTNARSVVKDPELLRTRREMDQYNTGMHGYDRRKERIKTAKSDIDRTLRYMKDVEENLARYQQEVDELKANPPKDDDSEVVKNDYQWKLKSFESSVLGTQQRLAEYQKDLQRYTNDMYERNPHRYDAVKKYIQAGMTQAKQLLRDIRNLDYAIEREQERIEQAHKDIDKYTAERERAKENMKRRLKGLDPLPETKDSDY